MSYQDPAPEPGIAIVFGFDDEGSGDFTPVPRATIQPIEKAAVEEDVIEDPVPVEEVKTPEPVEAEEEIMTQEIEDAIAIENRRKKEEKEEDERLEKEQERKEKERLELERLEKEKVIKAQEAKKDNLDNMFSNLTNTPDASGTDANQGDDGVDGYKGSLDGTKNAKSFSGNGGVGDYGNYQLGNRKPKNKPAPIYDGKDQGIVVVRILVDKNGKVVFAEAGAKGSTTTDLQLLKRAKEAALKTTWQGDSTAPEKQEGQIIYNFIIEN
ncbi:MAG: energy transducer TonB [Flavobacteriales bacterium]|nr:energy transducer TonB [Flavobacteriales bacterium]